MAPWGLSFIQSYAVDKRLTVADLRWERVDVVVGAVLTGVIGFFVVVACAATLHESGASIETAADAARALEPLAGQVASTLFGVGSCAALLAIAVLPLSTAYSVCEFTGTESALDDTFGQARIFYVSMVAVTALGAAAVLVPGAPLIPILVLTQVLNAVPLLPLLGFMYGLARDKDVMGEHAASRGQAAAYLVTIAFIGAAVLATLAFSLG